MTQFPRPLKGPLTLMCFLPSFQVTDDYYHWASALIYNLNIDTYETTFMINAAFFFFFLNSETAQWNIKISKHLPLHALQQFKLANLHKLFKT